MGNKNSSSHLTNHRSTHQQKSANYITNDDDDDSNNNIPTSSDRNLNSKKHGPSPRFRRRHARQVHLDKKTKRPQV